MNVEVIKVNNERPTIRQKNHGSSPRLYLELVENKDRVKQDLINKEYVPPDEPEISISDIEDDDEEIKVPDEKNFINDDEPNQIDSNTSGENGDNDYSKNKINNRMNELFTTNESDPLPPSLSEVTNGEKRYYRDISQINKTDIDEEDEKRQLLFKFDLLRKQYKDNLTLIPDFTILSDLKLMNKTYDATLQRLILDSSVEDYKSYFQKGCFAIEFVLNYMGFDISGFTNDQMSKMNTYERLLIELCAKHYNPVGSSIPVEIRLFGLILMNAAMFIGMKIIAKKIESSVSQFPTQQNNTTTETQRKMKGPQTFSEPI